jgi:hypothetical protein
MESGKARFYFDISVSDKINKRFIVLTVTIHASNNEGNAFGFYYKNDVRTNYLVFEDVIIAICGDSEPPPPPFFVRNFDIIVTSGVCTTPPAHSFVFVLVPVADVTNSAATSP